MVKALGALDSKTRTREQTEIAQFWGYGAASATPPGHWNQIAQAVVRDGNHTRANGHRGHGRDSREENARLFALLNMALADAAKSPWTAVSTSG